MNRLRLLSWLTFLALIATLAGASITSNPARAQSEQVYLALGDSIAAGLLSSLPDKRGYPAVLADLIETERLASDIPGAVVLINLAEPGETVQSFIDDGQLSAAIDQIDAIGENDQELRTVTLTLGGNDMLALWEMAGPEREADLERFTDAYRHVVEVLSEALDGRDTDVVVTTYYDLTEGDPDVSGSDSWWLARFNEVISDVATGAGFEVVDLDSVFRGQISSLTWFPADVHPNNAGHRAIAQAVWQVLEYDQAAPEISIERPEEGETRSRVPTIHAAVSDDVGVERVELHVDGERVDDLIYVPRLGVYVGLWDARAHPSSQAEITVVATDLAGNESSDAVSITLPTR
jgi:lysophospholipase L1-like esterase